MVFEFNSTPPRSVVDQERGVRIQMIPVEIGPDYGEQIEYRHFTYAQDALQWVFTVAYIHTPSYSTRAPAEGDAEGITQPGTYAAFILSTPLRESLERGLRRRPSEQEWHHTLNIIKEGLEAWAAGMKPYTPDETMRVFIVDSMETIAQRYPGRMPNYEAWSRSHITAAGAHG